MVPMAHDVAALEQGYEKFRRKVDFDQVTSAVVVEG